MPYHVKRLFYPFVPYLILFIGFIYLKTAGKSIFLIYSFDLKYALNTSSDPTFLLLAWRPASKQSFFYFLLTIEKLSDKIQNNFIHQTVEAEITAMMPLQRACAGESQVRNKLSNGPLRVQSKVPVFYRNPVFCNVKAYVSCRGYVGILLSAWQSHEFKVAPRIICTVYFCTRFVLDRNSRFLSGAFFYSQKTFPPGRNLPKPF